MEYENSVIHKSRPQRYKLSGLTPIFRAIRSITIGNEGVVKILLYHDVPNNKLPLFKSHIEYLKQKYTFITPEEFHLFLLGKKDLKGLNLLVTFDDGFKSSKYATEQVLDPLEIKALFFLTVDFIGMKDKYDKFVAEKIYDGCCSDDQFSAEHMPMDWEEVETLIEHGHSIGSHTINHHRLSSLNKEELIYEIFESCEKLEKALDIKVDALAYPFGDIGSIDKNAIDVIKQRYKFCYSGLRGFNRKDTSPFSVLRDEISLNYPTDYVAFIVENGLGWSYYSRVKQLNKMI